MADKKKILFVVDTLTQHGAERYLYEILKAIDKNKYECTVFCTYPLTSENDYYVPLIKDLNISIISFSYGELYGDISNTLLRKLLNSLTYRYFTLFGQKNKLKRKADACLAKQLEGYDIISILKIEVFNRFPEIFSKKDNIIVHLLSWGIQYHNSPYDCLPPRKYKFVTMYEDQKDDVYNTKYKTNLSKDLFSFFNFPLILDLSDRVNIYNEKNTTSFIVAVFSRLNFDQPTSMFLYAFHLLKKQIPQAKLFLYGKRTDPTYEGLLRQTAKILGIHDSLVFKGHTNNIEETIIQDNVSLGWMNIGQTTMGYSSIEISSLGLPVVFFNIGEKSDCYKNIDISVHDDLELFVEESVKLINDSLLLLDKSKLIVNYIKKLHDVQSRISQLELFYSEN